MESDEGKLFIGGIAWDTSEETLTEYFTQYGQVTQAVIMREKPLVALVALASLSSLTLPSLIVYSKKGTPLMAVRLVPLSLSRFIWVLLILLLFVFWDLY
jgi:hypothetical protein